MDMGEVLVKAWKIIWKHKILWLFGFLASCGSGSGGGGSTGSGWSTGGGSSNSSGSFFTPPAELERFFLQIQRIFQDQGPLPIWLIILLVVLFFIALIVVVSLLTLAITTIGRAGLVRGAWLADEGAERLSLGQLLKDSLKYFWRLFLLYLLLTLLVAVLVILLVLFIILTLGMGAVCIFPLICLLIPISIAVNGMIELTTVAIVGENLGIIDGLKRAWEIVKKDTGAVIIMALILIIGGGIVNVVIALPFIAILIPLAIGGLGSSLLENENVMWAGVALGAGAFCLYLPVAIVLGSGLQAYLKTAWTLTFRRLRDKATLETMAPDEVPDSEV